MSEFKHLGVIDFPEDYEPDERFTDEEIVQLKAMESGSDIHTVVTYDDWKDDHEICMNIELNGIKLAVLWITREFYALIKQAEKTDCVEAKSEIVQYVASYLDDVEVKDEKVKEMQKSLEEFKKKRAERDRLLWLDLKNMIEGGDSIVYAVEQVVNEENISPNITRKLKHFLDLAEEITELAGVEY